MRPNTHNADAGPGSGIARLKEEVWTYSLAPIADPSPGILKGTVGFSAAQVTGAAISSGDS